MPIKKNLSIVVPVLNESNNIQYLTDKIIKNLININYEIIFVDDNSIDSNLFLQLLALQSYFSLLLEFL